MKGYTFFKSGTSAKRIVRTLREQGEDVCRGVVGKEVVLKSINEADFGFARLGPVAQIGQKRKRPDTMHVHSFILGKTLEHPKGALHIELVCSRPNSRDGGVLMTLMEDYAKSTGYSYIYLYSIGEERLMRWYARQGFRVETTVHLPAGPIKAFHMVKQL